MNDDASTEDFPYKDYEKALEKVLEQVSKDYWIQYVDINRHQVAVARTYLWMSAAFIGTYFSSALLVFEKQGGITPCFATTLFFATVLAILALGVCLYALPARHGYKRIGQSWGTFSKFAYDALASQSPSLYRDTLTCLVDEFDSAAEHNLHTNLARARLLRLTSWLLIGSFALALVASIIILADYLLR